MLSLSYNPSVASIEALIEERKIEQRKEKDNKELITLFQTTSRYLLQKKRFNFKKSSYIAHVLFLNLENDITEFNELNNIKSLNIFTMYDLIFKIGTLALYVRRRYRNKILFMFSSLYTKFYELKWKNKYEDI